MLRDRFVVIPGLTRNPENRSGILPDTKTVAAGFGMRLKRHSFLMKQVYSLLLNRETSE
jgi:hypothetical protein